MHHLMFASFFTWSSPLYVCVCVFKYFSPWLVWLSGLSASLRTKGLLVRFPVRAHAWFAGQVPSGGCTRGNHTLMFLSLSSPSLPLCLKNKQTTTTKNSDRPLGTQNFGLHYSHHRQYRHHAKSYLSCIKYVRTYWLRPLDPLSHSNAIWS